MAITAKKQTAHIDSLTDNWMIVDLHRAFDTNECDLPLFFETIEAETIGLEEELGDHSFVEYEGKKLLLVAASEGKCNLVPRRIARGGHRSYFH